MGKDMFSLEWYSGVLVAGVSVDEKGLNKGWKEKTPVYTETGLDIKACKSWSWVTKLVKILLVETSETCWHLATSCKYYWRKPKALLVLIGFMRWLLRVDIV